MHELSIASNLITIVQQHMAGREQSRVRAVGVRIGGLVDISIEALQTGYEIATQGTPLAQSVLEIESVPIRAQCRACNEETQVARYEFWCSRCGGSDIDITSGMELNLAWIDIDEGSSSGPHQPAVANESAP